MPLRLLVGYSTIVDASCDTMVLEGKGRNQLALTPFTDYTRLSRQ